MEEANSGWSMIFILDLNCHVQDFWWFFPMFFSSIISPCWDQRPTDQLVDRSGIPTMLLMELSDPNFADQNAAFVLREFISSCLHRRGRWKDFWNGKNFHLGIITTQKKKTWNILEHQPLHKPQISNFKSFHPLKPRAPRVVFCHSSAYPGVRKIPRRAAGSPAEVSQKTPQRYACGELPGNCKPDRLDGVLGGQTSYRCVLRVAIFFFKNRLEFDFKNFILSRFVWALKSILPKIEMSNTQIDFNGCLVAIAAFFLLRESTIGNWEREFCLRLRLGPIE